MSILTNATFLNLSAQGVSLAQGYADGMNQALHALQGVVITLLIFACLNFGVMLLRKELLKYWPQPTKEQLLIFHILDVVEKVAILAILAITVFLYINGLGEGGYRVISKS